MLINIGFTEPELDLLVEYCKSQLELLNYIKQNLMLKLRRATRQVLIRNTIAFRLRLPRITHVVASTQTWMAQPKLRDCMQ